MSDTGGYGGGGYSGGYSGHSGQGLRDTGVNNTPYRPGASSGPYHNQPRRGGRGNFLGFIFFVVVAVLMLRSFAGASNQQARQFQQFQQTTNNGMLNQYPPQPPRLCSRNGRIYPC